VRRRLSLLVLAVTSMVVIAFVVPLALLVRDQARTRALGAAERTAQSVASGLAVAATLSPDLTTRETSVVVATSGDATTSIFMPDGTVVGAPAIASPALEQARMGRALTATLDEGVEILVPVSIADGVLVVRTVVADADLTEGVAFSWFALAALGTLLTAGGVALADRLGRTMVRPVIDLARAARRMGTGHLETRVDPQGPAEIADVGEAFNSLAERLDDLIAAERESLADLSHRLRTPLTALRLQAEMLGDPAEAAGMLEDLDNLNGQIDTLIAEARRRSPVAGPRHADLCESVRRRAQFWSLLAEEQGRPTDIHIPAGPLVVGITEDELGAAVETLLENVFSHTPAGTGYTVTVSLSGRGPILVVEDEGPGFPDLDVTRRGTSTAGSTGLGLDIVRRAAEHAGGEMILGSGPGGGARVEVRFGATPSP
jgi:signal transduction histidine kinase